MTKIGRNEPCPCGSGGKYKNCCLAKDEIEERAAHASAEAERQKKMAEENVAEGGDEKKESRPMKKSQSRYENKSGFWGTGRPDRSGAATGRNCGSGHR